MVLPSTLKIKNSEVIQMSKKKLIRMVQVVEQTGLSKTTIYELISEGEFPRQIKVGRISLWDESDVQSWICEQIKRSKAAQ
jgi:prophage regulatory protein